MNLYHLRGDIFQLFLHYSLKEQYPILGNIEIGLLNRLIFRFFSRDFAYFLLLYTDLRVAVCMCSMGLCSFLIFGNLAFFGLVSDDGKTVGEGIKKRPFRPGSPNERFLFISISAGVAQCSYFFFLNTTAERAGM